MSLIHFSNEQDRLPYAQLVSYIKQCQRCDIADNIGVRDIGNGFIPSDVMFVGEAEGVEERNSGVPFCGESGELIRNIWNKNGYIFGPNDLNNDLNNSVIKSYVTNTISCWCPPAEGSKSLNGKPSIDSINGCKIILWSKLCMVKPKVVVTLGEVATRNLLSLNDSKDFRISNYVGEWHQKEWPEVGKIWIVPTFHPSYVLRQGKPPNLITLYNTILEKIAAYINGSFPVEKQ